MKSVPTLMVAKELCLIITVRYILTGFCVFIAFILTDKLFVSSCWFSTFVCSFTEDSMKEIKENQWLGASVSSQGPGGKVVVRRPFQQNISIVYEHSSRYQSDYLGHCICLSLSMVDMCPSVPRAQNF